MLRGHGLAVVDQPKGVDPDSQATGHLPQGEDDLPRLDGRRAGPSSAARHMPGRRADAGTPRRMTVRNTTTRSNNQSTLATAHGPDGSLRPQRPRAMRAAKGRRGQRAAVWGSRGVDAVMTVVRRPQPRLTDGDRRSVTHADGRYRVAVILSHLSAAGPVSETRCPYSLVRPRGGTAIAAAPDSSRVDLRVPPLPSSSATKPRTRPLASATCAT